MTDTDAKTYSPRNEKGAVAVPDAGETPDSALDKRMQKFLQVWYLEEPALFAVACTHDFIPNPKMECVLRSGKGKLEYNSEVVGVLTDAELEELLRAEVIRIALKHPYERQPDGCGAQAKILGSNVCIGDNYDFEHIKMPQPEQFKMPRNLSFEQYSLLLEKQMPPAQTNGQGDKQENNQGNESSDNSEDGEANGNQAPNQEQNQNKQDKRNEKANSGSGQGKWKQQQRPTDFSNISQGSATDQTQNWAEDEMMRETLNETLERIEAENSWGTLKGNLKEKIIAGTKARIDYRSVLSGFRASILSSKRHLTRMRPSRRMGFDQLGAVRDFCTRLLVAVDVSGSVSDRTLEHFYTIVNRTFKYGIDTLDVVQFDCGLGEVCPFRKARTTIEVIGRGGTSFQEPIDYAFANRYDGLIILTDGYAPEPTLPTSGRTCKIVWVLDSEEGYRQHRDRMRHSGRVCYIYL